MDFTIEYHDVPGALWIVIEGKKYLLATISEEYIASKGHAISDLYWDSTKPNHELVRQIFQEIANKFRGIK